MILLKPIKLLILLVVLLLLAVLGVGFFADSLAKKAIEAAGSEALGVETTVGGCNVGFFSSTFSMDDLVIANPKGFGPKSFLEMGTGSVEVSAASLLSDKVEVPALGLSNIRLNLVQSVSGSNYGQILDNLDRFQGEAESEEGKRFVIKKLTLTDIVVTVVPVAELNLAEVTIPIDKIELKDIGTESDKGVLLADVAGIVVEAILKRASASGRMSALVKGVLDGKLGQLSGLADAGIEALGDLFGGTSGSGGKTNGLQDAKKALDALKGLGIGGK